MTASARHRTEFTSHLRARLAELEATGCGDQEHRLTVNRWINEVREELDAFGGGRWQEVQHARALVYLHDLPSAPLIFELMTELEQNELVRYVLDPAVALKPGEQMAVEGLGRTPVTLVCTVVERWNQIYAAPYDVEHQAHPDYTPVTQQIAFSANVHCPKCGDYNTAKVQIPSTPWADWLWRICRACGDTWRQYPGRA